MCFHSPVILEFYIILIFIYGSIYIILHAAYFLLFRYIVLQVVLRDGMAREEYSGISIHEAIKSSLHKLYGDFGIASIGSFMGMSFSSNSELCWKIMLLRLSMSHKRMDSCIESFCFCFFHFKFLQTGLQFIVKNLLYNTPIAYPRHQFHGGVWDEFLGKISLRLTRLVVVFNSLLS